MSSQKFRRETAMALGKTQRLPKALPRPIVAFGKGFRRLEREMMGRKSKHQIRARCCIRERNNKKVTLFSSTFHFLPFLSSRFLTSTIFVARRHVLNMYAASCILQHHSFDFIVLSFINCSMIGSRSSVSDTEFKDVTSSSSSYYNFIVSNCEKTDAGLLTCSGCCGVAVIEEARC